MLLDQENADVPALFIPQESDVIVKIYPGLSETKKKMIYGDNLFRIVASSGQEDRFKSEKIRFSDFKFFPDSIAFL